MGRNGLWCTAVLGLSLTTAQESKLPDGAELMDRVDAALHGENPKDFESIRFRGEVSFAGMPGTGTTVELFTESGQAQVIREFPEFGRFETGCDGEAVWEKSAMGIRVHDAEGAGQVMRRFARLRSTPWRSLYGNATCVGREDVEGADCFKLELIPVSATGNSSPSNAESSAESWFIQADILRPHRVISMGVGLDGQPAEVQEDYSDWREVEGTFYPHQVKIAVSGFVLQASYDSIETNVPIAAEIFAMDEEVARAAVAKPELPTNQEKEIWVEEIAERHFASIRVSTTYAELQRAFSVILPETMRYVMSINATVAGPPSVRFFEWGDKLDIEGGLPVTAAVAEKGRIKSSTLPGGKVAITWHVGPYDQLNKAHERMDEFLQQEGLKQRGAPWEEYLTDPGAQPDPSKWRTKIVYPVE